MIYDDRVPVACINIIWICMVWQRINVMQCRFICIGINGVNIVGIYSYFKINYIAEIYNKL